jgi:hypothetical protein
VRLDLIPHLGSLLEDLGEPRCDDRVLPVVQALYKVRWLGIRGGKTLAKEAKGGTVVPHDMMRARGSRIRGQGQGRTRALGSQSENVCRPDWIRADDENR